MHGVHAGVRADVLDYTRDDVRNDVRDYVRDDVR